MEPNNLRNKASLIRKNADFLEALPDAKSVELYASEFWYVPDNHSEATSHKHQHEGCLCEGVVVDYYSLVGLKGDPSLIIPLARLLEVLDLETKEKWGMADAANLLRWLKANFQLRYTGTGNRKCHLGTCDHDEMEDHHEPSLNFTTIGNMPIRVENIEGRYSLPYAPPVIVR